jgi:hypothetical protein
VFGAPRLVTAAEDGSQLKVLLTIGPEGFSFGTPTIQRLDLVVRDAAPECLQPVPPLETPDGASSCLPGRLSLKADIQITADNVPRTLTLNDFSNNLSGTVGDPLNHFNRDVIITVQAAVFLPAGFAPVTIALSGAGRELIFDSVGDVGGAGTGRELDVPARSIEVVQALNQVEVRPLPTRAVDLDAATSPRKASAVGFTHAFEFPPTDDNDAVDRIDGATLKLRLTGGVPASSNDFILLDRAVRDVARDTRGRVPLIYLRDIPGVSVVQISDGIYDFNIDLATVFIRFMSPGDHSPSAPQPFDLRRDIRDGRLNVIVAGKSVVDFSHLSVTLIDPPDPGNR